MRVRITKGQHTGCVGSAVPSRAVGPIDARVLLVAVNLDAGGCVEVPVDAICDLDTEIECSAARLSAIECAISAHYHIHPRLGWTVRRGMGGAALARLKDMRARAWKAHSELCTAGGRPIPIGAAVRFVGVSGRDHYLAG